MSAPVLIVGAGPAGLATAAALKKLGVEADLVDREGQIGGAYAHMHAAIELASPTRYTELPGLAAEHPREYLRAGEYLAYLRRYAEAHALSPERASLLSIARGGPRGGQGFRARLEHGGREEERSYEIVVAATGIYSHPSLPHIYGLNYNKHISLIHSREWRGSAALGEGRLLVIGGATSAIEIAEERARAGHRVTVSVRSKLRMWPRRFFGRDLHDYLAPLEALPRWLTRGQCDRRPTLPGTDLGFSEFRKSNMIDVKNSIRFFDKNIVYFNDGSSAPFEIVVAATGYGWRAPYLPASVRRARAGHPLAEEGESVSWPGLFLVGAPCARGTSSEFLRGIAKDAPAVATRIRARLAGWR